MVMVHGDNKGLVLSPRVAPIQIVVISVTFKGIDPSQECLKVTRQLQEGGIRTFYDSRKLCSPTRKLSEWEPEGAPIRLVIEPKEMRMGEVRVIRRDLNVQGRGRGRMQCMPVDEFLDKVGETLHTMQKGLLERAKAERDTGIIVAKTWDDFMSALNDKKMVLEP